jgi:prophage antirepressor-like protein
MSSLALSFNDVTFSPVAQNDGQIWLTSTELAKALGYAETDSVSKIYNRNKDEFTSHMTTTVKMGVVRKTGKVTMSVRLFSLRGCHLLAMFAKTEVAKQFRKWVLDLLDKEVGQPVLTKVEKTEPKPKTTVADRVPLKDAVNVLVAKSSLNYSDAYKMVHQFMGVDSIDQIPLEDLPRAVAYVHSLMLVAGRASHPLDAYALTNLKALVTHNFLMVSFYKTIEQPIKALNPSLWSHTFEHFWSAKSLAIGFNNQFDLGVDDRYLLPYRC